MSEIKVWLTKREMQAIQRSDGFDVGWGVRKSQAAVSAFAKLSAAIKEATDA